MKIYLVGGAVRDQLLGLPIKERDWVVVGATIEEMLEQGFKPVGKDFPVFLHPKTHEEYALARTERKIGKGYKGFQFYTAPGVTLEQDLARRDLTINAMAMTDEGKLLDPFHGQQDLTDKILRHVSPAFSEDPVRVLRVARFASRFHEFTIAPETLALMRELVQSGEIDALVPERVWQEFHRALEEDHPERFIEVLRDCGALEKLFPEIASLYGIPNPEEYHPEIDSGKHTLLALQQAVRLSPDPMIRFAVLVHDVGKSKTPKEHWPHHPGHHEAGEALVTQLCHRLRVPKNYHDLAVIVTLYHGRCHTILEARPQTVVQLLQKLDAFRRPDRFEQFLVACEADSRGRLGQENIPYPQSDFLKRAFQACLEVDIAPIIQSSSSPENIAQKLYQERVNAVKSL